MAKMVNRAALAATLLVFSVMALHYANVHDGEYIEWVPPWDSPASVEHHSHIVNGQQWQEGSPLEGHNNEWSYLGGDRTMRDWVVCAFDRNRDGDAAAGRAGNRNVNTRVVDFTVDAYRYCNTSPAVKRNNSWHQTGWAQMDRSGDWHFHWLNGKSRH